MGCTLGVGCDEFGVCFAMANGNPEKCGKPDTIRDVIADLRRPVTLSQFMGANHMALSLVDERAQIADRLSLLAKDGD